jgi:hypothetical protein
MNFFKIEKTLDESGKLTGVEAGHGWGLAVLGAIYGAGVLTGYLIFRK